MDKPMSNLSFQFMSLEFKIRDFLRPRMTVLKEAGIQPGFHVLDYGCGPGSYTVPAATLVGTTGRIYALDIHPLAIQKIQNITFKKRLTNVETIHSDCNTGLPGESINVVLLYDTFHDLADPQGVLRELYRVLKSDGILSFNDHHMEENDTVSKLTLKGLFTLSKKGKRTFSFSKAER
ncbi:MAG: class I SAM-dependent methyltransferase [Gemmatimonadota bacterium]|nr:MAG: class I SAM-dependent methyltransferase [Gemmatimonadota bacterium]